VLLLHGVFIIKIATRSGLRRFTAPSETNELQPTRERKKERRRAAIYIYARPRGVVNSTIHLNILHLALFSCCGIHTHILCREMESVPSGELLPRARARGAVYRQLRAHADAHVHLELIEYCASLKLYCSLL
jgi:hypothetical protein